MFFLYFKTSNRKLFVQQSKSKCRFGFFATFLVSEKTLQESFVRRMFPCFNDPHFRTNFQINVSFPNDLNFDSFTVLSNTPMLAFEVGERTTYVFEETFPIPSYLVALAVLNEKHHQLIFNISYSGIPIKLYADREQLAILKDKEVLQNIKDLILFTISFCESAFDVALPLSKIDFIMVELHGFTIGIENPGLITITNQYYRETATSCALIT